MATKTTDRNRRAEERRRQAATSGSDRKARLTQSRRGELADRAGGNGAILRQMTDARSGDTETTGFERAAAVSRREEPSETERSESAPGLTVTEPSSTFEREADRVAQQVMRIPAPRQAVDSTSQPAGDVRGSPVGSTANEVVTEQLLQSVSDGGRPLSSSARSFFEPRFGRSFGEVRIHTGGRVDNAARAIDARAFTIGRHIGFKSGEHDARSRQGRRLLAHELAHVEQQTGRGSNWSDTPPSMQLQPIVQRQATSAQPDPNQQAEANRAASQLHSMALAATSIDGFKSDVAAFAEGVVEPLGADAIVISLSGMAGSQYFIGGGFGVEFLYHLEHGWQAYLQAGGGFVTPGASGALEVGLIWGLEKPSNYTGWFIEAAGAYAAGWTGGSISGSITPDLATGGVKGGYAVGAPGIGVLGEWYWQIAGTETDADSDQPRQEEEEEQRGSALDVLTLAQLAGSAALTSPWRPSEWTLSDEWRAEEKILLQELGRLMRSVALEEIRYLQSMGVEHPFELFWTQEDTGSTTVRDLLGSQYDFLLRDVVEAVNAVANRQWGGDVLELELFDERSYLQIMRLLEDADLVTTYGEVEAPLRKSVTESSNPIRE